MGCGDGWDLEDLDSWMDANIFVISGTHKHPNPVLSGFRGFSRFSGLDYLKDAKDIKMMLPTNTLILSILKSSKCQSGFEDFQD